MKDYVGPSQRQHFIDRLMVIEPTGQFMSFGGAGRSDDR
jgi:hypothetical protein